METLFEVSRAVLTVAFLFYGVMCLVSKRMVLEFERYGLARLRPLVGMLEVAGGLGLLVGYLVPPLVVAASGGLALLMLMGVITRLRIRDSLAVTLPALVLLVVNGFVFVYALRSGAWSA